MDISGAPPTARIAFRLCTLPLDDTRRPMLKYNTLPYARIRQKYNTYATLHRALMGARHLPWQTCRDAALFPNYFGRLVFTACRPLLGLRLQTPLGAPFPDPAGVLSLSHP